MAQLTVVDSGDVAPGDDAGHAHSLIDPLTELGNHRSLELALASWQADPTSNNIAIISIGLQRFRHVVETLGHSVGDRLLQLAGKRLGRAARGDDTLIRLGGDEFALLHRIESESSNTQALAERLIELLARPYLIEGNQVNIGASVGIAVLGNGTNQIDDLMRHAELAMYEARSLGNNRSKDFDPSMELEARQRAELETALRRALTLQEFSLVYQPQLDMSSGDVTGFEALIRWHHTERGLVSPVEFIPVAEETGEIVAIGEWVMRTACCKALEWPDHLSVSVNVSPVQFESGKLADMITRALTDSGLDANRLEIEITESLLFSNMAMALNQLNAVRAMGVRVAMDDFGTGYSSLSYLNDIPFSKIKIDQSFVRGAQTPKTRTLVKAILSLGSCLGLETLAEGVETNEQYAELEKAGCGSVQGYLISKPMDPAQIPEFLNACEPAKRASGDQRG